MKTKEIYKIGNGNWGIVVGDNDGNYITTICVKSKKYANELSNDPKTLRWAVERTIKQLEKN
jgi:ribosomal protein L24E